MSPIMQVCFGVVLLLACQLTGYAGMQSQHPLILFCPLIAGVLYGVLTFHGGYLWLSILAGLAGIAFGIGAMAEIHTMRIGLKFAGLFYIPFLLILGVRYKRGTLVWK